jgi:DNA (cytosine-5)-methyltransferase 3A
MKVLSLFDGISVAQQALKELRVRDLIYYASEVDKYAIQVTQKNFPKTIHVGDITKLKSKDFQNIDLIIGGSPCQDLSIAKKNRQGLDGKRSGLFWEYIRLLKEIKPKYFVLENVASMSEMHKYLISHAMSLASGYSNNLFKDSLDPIMINASLVSAQNRKRLFWANIPNVKQPDDRGILLKDILENGVSDQKSYCLPSTYYKENTKSLVKRKKTGLMIRVGQLGDGGQGDRIYSVEGKSVNLSANGGGRGAKTGLYVIHSKSKTIRTSGRSSGFKDKHNWDMINEVHKLTPIECERLQSLPDNYTEGISNTQRYKCLGNAFNCAVIKHILSYIKI